MRRLKVTYKLTLLLAILSTTPIFIFGMGDWNDEQLAIVSNQRVSLCQDLATGCSLHVRREDYRAIEKHIEEFSEHVSHVASVKLSRFDGIPIHSVGEHDKHWVLGPDEESTIYNMRLPILRAGRPWATLEIAFDNNYQESQYWNYARAIGLTLLLNLISFGLLLRRALAVLDPATAVPRRVRNTLDTLAGGVVILDGQQRIVLANETFQKSCGVSADKLTGLTLDRFNWRIENSEAPWSQAMKSRNRCSGVTAFLIGKDKDERCFVVNATPVFDTKEHLAGTMVSFEDVTTLQQQKQTLLRALDDLNQSKEMIREQNLRLQELASKDGLTNVSNRRALFEELEKQWSSFQLVEKPLCCVMLDVDHFKKLNDTAGHATGDQVLREVARIITETVGDAGIVGRYGGEEFCVILPQHDPQQATKIAERVRLAICQRLADPYQVTASFGVSSASFGAASFQQLLEQADQSLYAAKHAGRNAVRLWNPDLAAEMEATNKTSRESAVNAAVQPISYQAVTSLLSALAYRDAHTASHSQRVAEMGVNLARGLMPVTQLYLLEIAGLLHDIGKIGVPDSVLLCPGRLTEEQWKIMEAHARIGVEIIESSFNSPALSEIVRYHHYRYDGINTPPGDPVGDEIPLGARVISIVDAFDAMVSDRVYRKGRSAELAFAELRRCAGTQFDPNLVERFINMPIGWRPDARQIHPASADQLAVQIGHLTERSLHAFETRDFITIQASLKQLSVAASKFDMPIIASLASELSGAISDRDQTTWKDSLPMLQDLVELCLMVQRSHVCGIASRPSVTENCPQVEFYKQYRDF